MILIQNKYKIIYNIYYYKKKIEYTLYLKMLIQYI